MNHNEHTKTITEVAEDLREELRDFIATRAALLRSELHNKFDSFKAAAPVLGIGFVLLGSAWLLLSGFLVCVIAQAFYPNPWRWTVSFLVVGVLYAIIGSLSAYLSWQQLKEKGIRPERTLRVLKQDGIWLHLEEKTQL